MGELGNEAETSQKKTRYLSYLGTFFLLYFLFALIGAMVYGIIYPGTEKVPEPSSSIIIRASAVAALSTTVLKALIPQIRQLLYSKKETTPHAHFAPTTDLNIPFSKKKQTEMAADILADIELNVSLANKADRVSFFIEWYDEALEGFLQLQRFDKVSFDGSPALDYYRLKDQFQWHLCDAIVRAKEKTITDITVKYRNSREFQRRSAEAFEDDINSIRNRCSSDTLALADASLAEVQALAGLSRSNTQNNYDYIGGQAPKYYDVGQMLSQIDSMEGHEFEHWCANLLLKTGFQKAEVTQASGDYGVDVLATKDGVRYAIQCKCYSKDLGSEPVREVNSGKSMPVYNCHVGAVMTNRYFTKNAIAEAEANHILLWDRDWIAGKLRQVNGDMVSSPGISKTSVVSKSPVIGKPTTISDSPPIPEKLSQYIHKAQWYAASKDDEE